MISPTFSHLLPSFPIEINQEILRFCDPPSLAAACLASFAFLELASPLLYHDVSIKGMEQLSRMLGEESQPPSPPPPHLASYLSLSQTRSITFVGTSEDAEWDTLLSLHRFPSSSPLRIEQLDISLDVEPGVDEHEESWSILLNLFNPVHVDLDTSTTTAFAWIPLDKAVWTEVKSICLGRCLSEGELSLCPVFARGNRKIAVQFDLRTFKTEEGIRMMHFVLDSLAGGGEEEGEDWRTCLLDKIDEATLVIGSEEQERTCLEILESLWEGKGVEVEERVELRSRIPFVRDWVVLSK